MVKPLSSQCDVRGGSLRGDHGLAERNEVQHTGYCNGFSTRGYANARLRHRAPYRQASQQAIIARSFNNLTGQQGVEPLNEESAT